MFEIEKLENQNWVNSILKQFINTIEEVPFGNSDFQNKTSIVNGEISPHRAYRHSALRIMNRLNALNECYYSLKENDIKIKRLEREIERLEKNQPEDYDLDIEEKIIEIEKIKSTYTYTQKLIKDAIQEINVLSPIIESVWKLDRKTFESMEENHFKLLSNMNEKEKYLLSLENNLFKEITQNNILKLNK